VSRAATVALRLRVDPVACAGVGVCAQLADRNITLDRWGYPIVDGELQTGAVKDARRAVRACPRRALWLEEAESDRR
jgi:ferredoxin